MKKLILLLMLLISVNGYAIDSALVKIAGENGNYIGDTNPFPVKIAGEDGSAIGDTNPFPVYDVDSEGRQGLNTVFGEQQIGIRRADIAVQFQYGYVTSAVTTSSNYSGSISVVESLLCVESGVSSNGYASYQSRKALRYIAGHEAYMMFTAVFSEGKAGSYARGGLYDDDNGLYVGYEGTDYCVTRRRNGVDYVTTVNASEVYSGFDPQKGQIYRISFGYLGYATIHFEVMTPSGGWARLHEIAYPNTSTGTHILNTNIPPRFEVGNGSNTSNVYVKSASYTAGIINGGGTDPSSRRFTFSSSNITVSAGDDMLITFRSRSNYNGVVNYIQSILSMVNISTDLSKSALVKFVKNMTFTNTPTYTSVNSASTIEYSLDATVTSGTGEETFAVDMAKSDRLFEIVEGLGIELLPQDTMTIIVSTAGGTSGTYDFVLRWKELF